MICLESVNPKINTLHLDFRTNSGNIVTLKTSLKSQQQSLFDGQFLYCNPIS